MILTILWVLFYFLAPILIIWLCIRYAWLDKIGAVLINYGLGILLANINVLPDNFTNVQETLITILIPLAIPLLLFTAEVKTWVKMIGKSALAFVLGIIALLITVYSGFYFFSAKVDGLNGVAGMLVGVYTGGTPNLASIKTALNVPADLFIVTSGADMLIAFLYLFFILTIGQKVLGLVLPKFDLSKYNIHNQEIDNIIDDTQDFTKVLKKENLKFLPQSLFLSILISAIGIALSFLVSENSKMLTVILTITTLAILSTTQEKVRKIKNSFQLGLYFIHAFSLIVASMADFSEISALNSTDIFLYVTWVVFGSVLLHAFFSYLFKIDVDTFIIISICLIFSPPFVPLIADKLKNKYIIISGITGGIVGYAIGNYLGIFVALSLK